MPRPVHFEIPVNDAQRAVQFYGDLFGWQFTKWEGPMEYWLVSTGAKDTPGIDGGLVARQHPGQTTVNTVDVASVDDAVSKATAMGGQVAVPRMPIPGVGWLAYLIDPDGNVFGVMETDESAA